MTSIRAIQLHRDDDKRVQGKLVELPEPTLNDGEVKIAVAYSSLNFKDALAITGKGKIAKTFPIIAGIDLSGTVTESRHAKWSAGDQILATGCLLSETVDGGLTEIASVHGDKLVALPAGLTLRQAMQLGTAGFTAGLATQRLVENRQTPELGPIAVTGATGGVGSFAVNILSQAGFAVTAVSRKDSARDYLTALGANDVVTPDSLDLGARPLESGQFGGVVDNVGGELLSGLTRVVNEHGNIACIGLAGGHTLETTVMPFILRGVSLLGVHSVGCPMDQRLSVWNHLATDWKPTAFDQVASHTTDLDGVQDACAQIMAGEVTGRFLVEIGGDA